MTGGQEQQGPNAVAIGVNGVPVYNIQSKKTWNNEGEWTYINVEHDHELNTHGEVTDGVLHYHVFSPRVTGSENWSTTEHSPIIGWALDGLTLFPMVMMIPTILPEIVRVMELKQALD